MNRTCLVHTNKSQAGFSILETLISLSLSMFIFAITTTQFGHISKLNRDMKIKEAADRYARTIVNLMGFDIRIIGNGIPFDQNGFQIGSASLLGTASDRVGKTEPIILSSLTEDNIVLRLSESGDVYVLTDIFNPAPPSSHVNITLTSVAGLGVNDTIYITNGSVGGHHGYYGRISAIDSVTNIITIYSNDYAYSPEGFFSPGSLVVKVSNISYGNSGGNIVRQVDSGPSIVLAPGSAFTMRYLDYEGSEILLAESPEIAMTHEELRSELATIEVTVFVQGRARLTEDKNNDGQGDIYTAVARQIFSLRNLNIIQST